LFRLSPLAPAAGARGEKTRTGCLAGRLPQSSRFRKSPRPP